MSVALDLTEQDAHVLRYALSDYIEAEAETACNYRDHGDLAGADELDANVATAKEVLARLGV